MAFSFDSMTVMDVHVQNFGGIIDLAQRWNKHKWHIWSVLDSQSWKHITKKWPNFATEAKNIQLGLTLDGVHPFGDLNSYHFTWPIVLLNYNFPPWLVTKHYFMMLALIILGKEFVTFGNIDVYLELVIEELQML